MTDAGVVLVPHTHWDREWYEPFQRFRLRLVDLLDDVIARAHREPDFCFTLDGQMAAIDDYLEVRPERRDEVAALVAEGRLAVGPWRVLLDEFLCSGENIIRNLELGLAGAEGLGRAMRVGYLPDEFGHCAQMPQILARAGLRHACLWRGVPAAVDTHAFRWVAPDGSAVRTEYLVGGYGNVADLFNDADGIVERAQRRLEQLQPWFGDTPVLAMYGTDHAAPLPTLMDQVRGLDAAPQLPGLRVATLADYVEARDPDETGLPSVTGELRSHARANILPGVISVRWHLKAAMAGAERMVERWAEPLGALWLPASGWPQRYLDMAWVRLVDSSCHDSVTGCGVDETALQVAARIAEAEHLGHAVRDQATARLAAAVPVDQVLVVNPVPATRTGLVTVDVAVPSTWKDVALELPDGTRVPTQEAGRNDELLSEERITGAELVAVFRRVHDRELFGRQVTRVELETDGRPTLTFHVAADPGPAAFDVAAERARAQQAGRDHPGEWILRIVEESRRTLHAVTPAPPLGVTSLRPVEGDPTGLPAGEGDAAIEAPVSLTGDGPGTAVVANALVEVAVTDDGTLTLRAADGTVLEGVGRLVDGGDCGDTYNYGPPSPDRLVDTPESVAVEVRERGPLRAVVSVHRRYLWPSTTSGSGRSGDLLPVDTTLTVELRAGEPFVRLAQRIDNRCRDHRVRLHVPVARSGSTSHAQGQLAVVERGPAPEAGDAGEHPIPTYPAYDFVDAGGAGVLLTRATEYELVDGRELALTLVRSVGWLSRNVHPYRDEPAGPQIPTPDAQCPGLVQVELAVLPHTGSWEDAGLVALGEAYRHGLLARAGTGPAAGAGPARLHRDGLSVDGDGVVMSSLRRRGGWLELRLVALSTRPVTATVRGGFRAVRRADLLGEPGETLESPAGELRLPMQPFEIATVQLEQEESLLPG